MTVGLVLGAVLGAGVWLTVRGLYPAPGRVAADIARLSQPRWGASSADSRQWIERLALALVRGPGTDPERIERDLAVVGRSLQRHALDRLLLMAVGASLPLLVLVATAAAGESIGPGVAGLACIGCGVAGWLYATTDLRNDARARRRSFRHALAVYLDLVNVLLAGGTGVEGALDDAANVGEGWAFSQIRQALATARLNRESPWAVFDRLSVSLEVPELAELSSSVALAGDSGARVRESLAAKAVSMRDQELAQAQAEAEANSERMSVPLVAMATGFLLLVGYPALAQVLQI